MVYPKRHAKHQNIPVQCTLEQEPPCLLFQTLISQVLTDKMIDITSATAEIKLGEEFYLSEQNGNIIL